MLKKYIAKVILFIFVITCCIPVYAELLAENTEFDKAYEEAVSTFEGLGIFKSNIAYFEGETVTRAQMAELLLNMMKIQDISSSDARYYIDVKDNHTSYKAIESVTGMKLMSGHGNQMFEPEVEITFNEAVKIMICAIGYQSLAEVKGGYPTGYMRIATSEKMLKSVRQLDGNKPITGRDLAVLMFNTMRTDMMHGYVYSNFGEHMTETMTETNENILKVYHDISIVKAIVESDNSANIYGDEPCEDGEIVLDGICYNCEYQNNMLGCKVNAYIKDTDDNDEADTVVYMYLSDDNKIFEIKSEDLTEYSSFRYKYSDGKSVQITENTYILYNGKAMEWYDETLMMPDYGYIKLVSNDKDNIYDVLFIYNQFTVATDVVSANNGFVTDIYDTAKNLRVDLEDDSIDFKVFKNGDEITLKQVVSGDVLTVEKSQDEKLIRVYVSDKKVDGVLERISSDYIMITGEKYKTVPGIIGTADFKIGLENTFLFDIYGRVAGAKKVIDENWLYGIVLVCGTKGSLKNAVQLKMFTELDEETIYEVADKVLIDGRKVEKDFSESDGSNYIIKRINSQPVKLIRFKQNDDGKIKEIDTLYHGKEYGEDEDSLYQMAERKRLSYNASYYTFSGKMNIGSKTIIFQINPVPTGETEDDYRIVAANTITGNKSYEVEGYSASTEDITPDVVLLHHAGAGGIGDTAKFMIVDTVGEGFDNEGNVVSSVTGTLNGVMQEVMFKQGLVPVGIKSGDIIRYGQNAVNLITEYEKVYDAEKGELAYSSNPHSFHDGESKDGGSGGEDFFTALVHIWKIKDGQAIVTYDREKLGNVKPDDALVWKLSGASVYIYEINDKGKVDVKVGKLTDIIGYNKDSENASTILINSHWWGVSEVFIIK